MKNLYIRKKKKKKHKEKSFLSKYSAAVLLQKLCETIKIYIRTKLNKTTPKRIK